MFCRYRIVVLCAVIYTALSVFSTPAQTLNLPPRPANAPGYAQFTNIIFNLSLTERENWIYAQIISGNIPGWERTLKPVTVSASGHTATYYVTPDVLAIGSDTDYLLEPMTPLLAQRLADRLGCSLPTRKMSDQIWSAATVKMVPQPVPYTDYLSTIMTSVLVFASNSVTVTAQRNTLTNSKPLGALVAGDKKDVIISGRIYTNFANGPSITKPVVIYGWHNQDGTHIQPLYNGHEETYADYSHGIRLVQMAMTVDGSPNTVTNVLTSASLRLLLSDDGLLSGDGATASTDGTIPLPRYTVAALRPSVMIDPRDRSALPGTNLTLNALPIGDAPLNYKWLLNGTPIPGATNATLTVTNFQPATAGSYSVIVTNFTGADTSRVAILRLKTTDFPVLFSDDFETNSAEKWSVFWGASNGIPDYTVDFAYDYGSTPYTFNGVTALIPPAPNSPDGRTHGVRLTVNNNDLVQSVAAVNLYPKNFSVSNNFALKFDLWINYPGNWGGSGSGVAGSTQFAEFGLNHAGTNVDWAAPANLPIVSDGLWFAMDGEGGTTIDYRAYLGNPAGTQIDLSSSPNLSGLIATSNVAFLFTNLFPTNRYETPGAPGKSWVEVELRQTNNIVLWFMNGTLIAQRTNSSVFTGGKIMLGLMDPFPSVANPIRDTFVIFDNVRVENLAPPMNIQNLVRQPDGTIALTLNSALGDNFTLESSTDLVNWQPVTGLTLTNNPITITNTPAGPRDTLYYRTRR